MKAIKENAISEVDNNLFGLNSFDFYKILFNFIILLIFSGCSKKHEYHFKGAENDFNIKRGGIFIQR